jgi:hypothetical protein
MADVLSASFPLIQQLGGSQAPGTQTAWKKTIAPPDRHACLRKRTVKPIISGKSAVLMPCLGSDESHCCVPMRALYVSDTLPLFNRYWTCATLLHLHWEPLFCYCLVLWCQGAGGPD